MQCVTLICSCHLLGTGRSYQLLREKLYSYNNDILCNRYTPKVNCVQLTNFHRIRLQISLIYKYVFINMGAWIHLHDHIHYINFELQMTAQIHTWYGFLLGASNHSFEVFKHLRSILLIPSCIFSSCRMERKFDKSETKI